MCLGVYSSFGNKVKLVRLRKPKISFRWSLIPKWMSVFPLWVSLNQVKAWLTVVVLVTAYALNRMGTECVELFRQVPVDMLDEATYVNVLNGCSHYGLTKEAHDIFETIPVDNRTKKIYTIMAKMYVFAAIFKFLLINQCLDRWLKSFVWVQRSRRTARRVWTIEFALCSDGRSILIVFLWFSGNALKHPESKEFIFAIEVFWLHWKTFFRWQKSLFAGNSITC